MVVQFFFNSIMWARETSSINELTRHCRPRILQYCIVYKDLKKARFWLMAVLFYFYSIMAPKSFHLPETNLQFYFYSIMVPWQGTVVLTYYSAVQYPETWKRQDSDWRQFSSISTPSWGPRASSINERTAYCRMHILQYCTVYIDLEKERFWLMAVQFYFYSIMAPESFFFKLICRVLSRSHTTVQYCTVYRDLKKARFWLMAVQFYFYSIMAPESFFHTALLNSRQVFTF
jgi:hypothetical protein